MGVWVCGCVCDHVNTTINSTISYISWASFFSHLCCKLCGSVLCDYLCCYSIRIGYVLVCELCLFLHECLYVWKMFVYLVGEIVCVCVCVCVYECVCVCTCACLCVDFVIRN